MVRLTPDRCHVHRTDGLRLGKRRFGTLHVVARSLCRMRYFDLSQIPKADRLAALRVQIKAWSPYVDAGYALVMGEQGATVLAWDQAQAQARLRAADLSGKQLRLMPETLLLPGAQAGLFLRRCVEGFEGQYWRDGLLVVSRWWRELPGGIDWLNFQRAAGLSSNVQQASVPAVPASATWQRRPWGRMVDRAALFGSESFREHVAVGLAMLLLIAPTLWYGKIWFDLHEQSSALAMQKAGLEQTNKPILQARDQALRAMRTLAGIAQQVDHADATALMAHLSRRLSAEGVVLRELEFANGRLNLVLNVPSNTSHISFIKGLEGGGWLREVREMNAADPNTMTLTAKLAGNQPPLLENTQSGSDSPVQAPWLPGVKVPHAMLPATKSGAGASMRQAVQ